jgi:hypothetical protein
MKCEWQNFGIIPLVFRTDFHSSGPWLTLLESLNDVRRRRSFRKIANRLPTLDEQGKRKELQEKSFYSLQHQLTFEYKTHHCRLRVFLRSNIHQEILHTVQAFAKTTAIKLSPTQKIGEIILLLILILIEILRSVYTCNFPLQTFHWPYVPSPSARRISW